MYQCVRIVCKKINRVQILSIRVGTYKTNLAFRTFWRGHDGIIEKTIILFTNSTDITALV